MSTLLEILLPHASSGGARVLSSVGRRSVRRPRWAVAKVCSFCGRHVCRMNSGKRLVTWPTSGFVACLTSGMRAGVLLRSRHPLRIGGFDNNNHCCFNAVDVYLIFVKNSDVPGIVELARDYKQVKDNAMYHVELMFWCANMRGSCSMVAFLVARILYPVDTMKILYDGLLVKR